MANNDGSGGFNLLMCQRKDSTENWQTGNPVLLEGELGYEETDQEGVLLTKIGDGITHWNDLPYVSGPIGPSPEHEWQETSLRFRQPDGTWGEYVNLKGPQGIQGPQGEQGEPGTAIPATTTTLGGIIVGEGLKANAEGCLKNIVPAWNSEIWVDVSGDFTAPVEGLYYILAIDGGQGCGVDVANNKLVGGQSGAYKEAIIWLEQGQIIPIIIGAGSLANNNGAADLGGITSVGDIDFSRYLGCFIRGEFNHRDPNNHSTSVIGGGFGGSNYTVIGSWPGAGGGGFFGRTDNKPSAMQNGRNGAVRFRYYDPDWANGQVTDNGNNEAE